MLKQLIVIFLLILCSMPIASAETPTTCPTCPPPKIVYVTVTIPVPVPQTPIPTPVPTQAIPTQVQSTGFYGIPEYAIYGALFLILIGGIIMTKLKQRKKGQPSELPKESKTSIKILNSPKGKYDNLYEEDEEDEEPIKIIVPPKREEQKPKKPKKPKSLLDQDFEF